MKTHVRHAATWLIALSATIALAADPTTAAPVTAPGAPAPASQLPWPARLTVDSGLKPETLALKGASWSCMGTIESVKPPITSLHLGSWDSPSAVKSQTEDWAIFRARSGKQIESITPQYERPGSFIYVPSYEDEPATPSPNRSTFMFRFISARPPTAQTPGDAPKAVIERTWFAYYDPLPPKAAPGELAATEPQAPRALIVFLPGTFGTPTDQIVALIRRLRLEGYAVLRMMAQPSRFTESVTYSLPLEGDITASVPAIAADLSDRAAEAAYAVEAGVLYAQQERPELRALPRLAIGMSGGAMLLPVVVAREPSAYAGAVSIAGGVDYLRILSTSNYANWIDAVRVKWTGAPASKPPADGAPPAPVVAPAKRLDELCTLYRAAAPLDSANLVGLVKTVPWLLLHGSSDKAVPAVTGDEMWELLGKPDRITVKGGHELIFLTLGGKFNAIVEWVNKHARPAPAPKDAR